MTKDWLPHRDTIIRLYKTEGNALDRVQKIMHEDYAFDASIRAFRSWLKKWGVTKYNRSARKRWGSIEPPPRPPCEGAKMIKTEEVPGPILHSRPRSVPVKREPMEPCLYPPSPDAQKSLPGHGAMPYPQNTNGLPTPPARYIDHRESPCSAPGDSSGVYYGPNGENIIRGHGLFSESHQNGGMQTAPFPIRSSFGGPPQCAYPNSPLLMPPQNVYHNYESQYTHRERGRPYMDCFPQGPVTPPKQSQHFTAQKKSPTMPSMMHSHMPSGFISSSYLYSGQL